MKIIRQTRLKVGVWIQSLRPEVRWPNRTAATVGWVMVAALGLAVVIQAFALRDRLLAAECQLSVNWGNVPDWLTGLGAMAAFAALFFAASEWRHTQAERRDSEGDQARLVVLEVVEEDRSRGTWDLLVTVRNHSSAPVLDVRAERTGGAGALGYWQEEISHGVRHIDPVYEPILLPGETIPPFRFSLSADVRNIRLTFTDAHGRRWKRDGRKQPERALTDDPADEQAST